MRKFSVSIDEFHQHYAVFDLPRIDTCMDELIERYGIHGNQFFPLEPEPVTRRYVSPEPATMF